MAGQILGDMVKGRLTNPHPSLCPELIEGIRLHRRIDSVADRHPAHRALRSHFPASLRRYAGILVDIGLDHALATRWHALNNDESLADFAYRAANQITVEWPSCFERRAPEPAAFAELLAAYDRPEGIKHATRHVASRLRRGGFETASAARTILNENRAFSREIGSILADLAAMVIAERDR